MKLLFLGTGTSTGIPTVGCTCAVCRSDDPLNNRLRSSVLVSQGAWRHLIDAGPEFRLQCLRYGIDRLDSVSLTHPHADHILGLDDLRPLTYHTSLPVYLDESTHRHLQRTFPYFFSTGPSVTSKPRLDFRLIEGPFTAGPLTVTPIPVLHGSWPILGFRIGNLAYLTDCSEIPAASRPLLEGLDLLVLDALRHTPHPTHFNLEGAVAEAKKIGARQTLFTHISHELDHRTVNAGLPAGMALAYDGQEVELP